ncbi:MAG: hypothetical protein ABI927_05300, partial [Gaiellaceae bacterium]
MGRGFSGLILALVVAGCHGTTAVGSPSRAEQQAVAGQFAAALLSGDVPAARALLAPQRDGALDFLVRRAVRPWKGRHAVIHLPARHVGQYWAVGFARRRTHGDGTFVRQSGDLVISIGPSPRGASVSFFALENLDTRYSTHR